MTPYTEEEGHRRQRIEPRTFRASTSLRPKFRLLRSPLTSANNHRGSPPMNHPQLKPQCPGAGFDKNMQVSQTFISLPSEVPHTCPVRHLPSTPAVPLLALVHPSPVLRGAHELPCQRPRPGQPSGQSADHEGHYVGHEVRCEADAAGSLVTHLATTSQSTTPWTPPPRHGLVMAGPWPSEATTSGASHHLANLSRSPGSLQ